MSRRITYWVASLALVGVVFLILIRAQDRELRSCEKNLQTIDVVSVNDTIECFIRYSEDLSSIRLGGESLIHLAARLGGGTNLVPELLNRGCDINFVHPVSGHSALHTSAYNVDLEWVSVLIEFGADVSLRNSKGETALELAQYSPRKQHVSESELAEIIRLLSQGSRKAGSGASE